MAGEAAEIRSLDLSPYKTTAGLANIANPALRDIYVSAAANTKAYMSTQRSTCFSAALVYILKSQAIYKLAHAAIMLAAVRSAVIKYIYILLSRVACSSKNPRMLWTSYMMVLREYAERQQ